MNNNNVKVNIKYNPIEPYNGNASVFSSVMSLSNTVLGAGLLVLPYAISKCGFIIGVLMIVLMSIMSMLSLYMLMYAASFEKERTNWSLLGVKYMPKTMKLVDFLCLLGNTGACAGYLIIIGDLMPDAIRFMLNVSEDHILTKRYFWICIFLLFIIPLVSKTTFDKLRYFSTLAIFCFGYILLMCQLYAYVPKCKEDLEKEQIGTTTLYPTSALAFLKVIPILITAFNCHMNSVAISSELKNPTPTRIIKSIFLSIGLCTIFYISVGLAGYLTFGDKVQSDILLNYPNTWLVTILRVLLSIAIIFSYPMWCNPTRESFCVLFLKKSTADLNKKFFYIVTYGIVFVTFIIALCVKDLGIIVALIGSVSNTSCVYIMPGFLYYYIVPNQSKISQIIVRIWGIVGCIMLPALTILQFI